MSKPAKPPSVIVPAPPKPLRTAYDIRAAGPDCWQVIAVIYGDGLSEERVVFESASGPIAASAHSRLTREAGLPALTGFAPEAQS